MTKSALGRARYWSSFLCENRHDLVFLCHILQLNVDNYVELVDNSLEPQGVQVISTLPRFLSAIYSSFDRMVFSKVQNTIQRWRSFRVFQMLEPSRRR